MGLFKSVLKAVDSSLKAVENGDLEKSIGRGLDRFEQLVDSAPEKLKEAAGAPEKALDAVKAKAESARQQADRVQEAARDIRENIERKD
jgi:methyl-accepting chemotaxis protein